MGLNSNKARSSQQLTGALTTLFLCNSTRAFKERNMEKEHYRAGFAAAVLTCSKIFLPYQAPHQLIVPVLEKSPGLSDKRELLLTSIQHSLPKDCVSPPSMEQPNGPTISSQVCYNDSYPPPHLVSAGRPKQDTEELQCLGKGPYQANKIY